MRAWLRSHLGVKRWASLRLNNWLWGIFLPSLWEWLSGRNEVSWESVEQHARLRPMPSQISVRVWESRGVVLPGKFIITTYKSLFRLVRIVHLNHPPSKLPSRSWCRAAPTTSARTVSGLSRSSSGRSPAFLSLRRKMRAKSISSPILLASNESRVRANLSRCYSICTS